MLDLKEIIWEITNCCNNKCSYCGSTQVTNKVCDTSEEQMVAIAKAIAAYPPESIDISGGDPTLVSSLTHTKILEVFRNAGIVPKILMNPLSIVNNTWKKVDAVISQYDVIGVSINVEDEYTIFNEHQKKFDMSKVTFVSNFNKTNLWMFDRLLALAMQYNRPWQIQFTMYTEENSNAIYESEIAINEFFTKIADARSKYAKIALGDNINRGTCTGGIHTLGVLSSGAVIPCVSMRAWIKNVEAHTQGNLLKGDSLKDIWETQFKDQRFSQHKCCATHCKGVAWRKDVEEILSKKITKIDLPDLSEFDIPDIVPGGMDDIILMYGIVPDRWPKNPTPMPPTMVYGVTPNTTMVYGVVQDPTSIDISNPPDIRDNPIWKHIKKDKDNDNGE